MKKIVIMCSFIHVTNVYSIHRTFNSKQFLNKKNRAIIA